MPLGNTLVEFVLKGMSVRHSDLGGGQMRIEGDFGGEVTEETPGFRKEYANRLFFFYLFVLATVRHGQLGEGVRIVHQCPQEPRTQVFIPN
jgi:hypothetical protein